MAEELLKRLGEALSDRYALKRELGRGGMAVVFLAEDVKHRRPVAVKVIRPEVASSLGHERFLREIQVAAHLNHPHILSLYESGEADGLLYYVMPYMEGESLKERLERSGAMRLGEALRIAGEVADALSYAHGQGLVHRDIKPENILLSSGHAVVADFGLCRAMGEAGKEGLTQAGMTLGTPAYMSPEQWERPDAIDGRSDVYSLGCVLYEMLVGDPPFTGSSAQAIMARHAQQEVPSARIVRSDIPEEIESVLSRALAKLPDERFQSALEFGEALSEVGSASSAPGSTLERSPVIPNVSRASAGAALGVIAVGALAFAISTHTAPDSPPPTGDRVRLVVLPFDNFDTPETDYFADGITEGITTRLSGIGGLGVIAQSSARQYRGNSVSIREIGNQLDVAYILEGSLRCTCVPGAQLQQDDTLSVNARLTQVSDETQVWGSQYTVALREVFSVQGGIAEAVARTLSLDLRDQERTQLEARPTGDMAAYDLYLRGNEHYRRGWARSDVEAAISAYERALELDPQFAPALARLGQAHAWMYRLQYDVSESRLTQAREALDRALAINPDLAEAHLALGLYHYWGRWDYERAMDALLTAAELQPGNALVARHIGNVRRRQGAWDETLAGYERAAELDPRSHNAWFNLGETYAFIGQYQAAIPHLNRVLSLVPDFFDAHLQLAYIALWARGDVEASRRIIEEAARRVPPEEWRPMYGFWLHGFTRIVYPNLLERDGVGPGTYALDTTTFYLAHAEMASRAGDRERARAYADSARMRLEEEWDADPSRSMIAGQLALAYAELGRDQEALEFARRAVDLSAHDAFDGPDWILNLARVLMMTGDREGAIDQLELVMAIPSRISPHLLRLDPVWDPLRDHERFQRLAATAPSAVAVR